MDYKTSGVDIDAGNETVRRIRALAKGTFTSGVLSDIGSFGGLFKLDTGAWKEPVLVSSADGVGTKLKVAFMMNRHRTIGADLVNHCVNDILVQGAVPLFFLDYLATGRLSPDVAEQIVDGLAGACRANGCALLGGETAEMPGFYADGEYDVAGFIVGAVDRANIIDGRAITAGDVLIGLPSNGLHTNGYSLARKIAFDTLKLKADSHVPELGESIGEALLRTHRSYLNVIRPLITGGGITDNLPRVLPEGTAARVDRTSWRVPAIFRWLGESGRVPEYDMRRALNMGIGLILVVSKNDADAVRASLLNAGEANSIVIGDIIAGDQDVQYV
jgi:phosphoribosylformylglycinamidine cyclo-ligase